MSSTEVMSSTEGPRPHRGAAWLVVAVVALLLMVPIGFFYLTSGLVVPGPWLFVLWAMFLALVVLAVWLTRRRSWWVAAVPVAAALLWWGFLSAGAALFDWTA